MIVIVNVVSDEERNRIPELRVRFGESLRVVSTKGADWRFKSMDKTGVKWTQRVLEKALKEDTDTIVKIDPDTIFNTDQLPQPSNCDIAGDFRYTSNGWVWFGAWQWFTREAAEKILNDPAYKGDCQFQDTSLAASARRLGLKALNLNEVNGWSRPTDPIVSIMHPGRGYYTRQLPGIVNWERYQK